MKAHFKIKIFFCLFFQFFIFFVDVNYSAFLTFSHRWSLFVLQMISTHSRKARRWPVPCFSTCWTSVPLMHRCGSSMGPGDVPQMKADPRRAGKKLDISLMVQRQRLPKSAGASRLLLETQSASSDPTSISASPSTSSNPSNTPSTRVRRQCVLAEELCNALQKLQKASLQGTGLYSLQLLSPLNRPQDQVRERERWRLMLNTGMSS